MYRTALLLLTLTATAAAQRATPAPNWPFRSRATPTAAAGKPAPPLAQPVVTGGVVTLSPAQLAALNVERAKLLHGVKTIPKLGAPGPVVAYGALAFPLVATSGGKTSDAVAAAGSMGKGRAVIFGHTGYIDGDSAEGDLGTLLINAVRWTGGKEKPRVLLKGAKCVELLQNEGLSPMPTSDKLDQKTLRGYDVVIASAQRFTDGAEAAALKEFIEAGGGYIGAITGWAFSQSNPGREFSSANLANEVLAGAGLGYTDASLGDGSLEVSAEISPLLNAFTAIAALAPKSGVEPAADAVEQGSRTLRLALAAMPPANRPAYQRLIARAFAGAEPPPIPTPEAPLTTSDAAARARVSLEAQMMRFYSAAEIQPHPAAEKFPGRVPAGAKVITKTVTIDPAIPGWQSTGLYADAGAKIVVKATAELSGYAVRIGCHTDRLYSLEKWKRMPELTATAPLDGPETLAASPFGGLIYITVPDKAKELEPFQVSIAGAVEAPLYVHGKTTDAQWKQMRALPAPWAEMACQGVILALPIDVARTVEKPAELMDFWQRVVDAEDDLSGVAARRRRPERIVPDVQISAGFMHSGYPIMVHLPEAKDMVKHGPAEFPGWGFYHEIGHNHQESPWGFAGTGEVTCNLFSLYVVEAVERRPMRAGHGAVTVESQDKKRQRHLAGGAPFDLWKADPFLALGSYIQLIEGFGFDALKTVLRTYQGNELGPLPKSDDEKRDQWMVRYAKTVGKNLGPFFDKWGIPVSSSAKAEIASLPEWMPADMK